ncbi:MAG: Coq4 family protein [Polyangiaceae bacterium]
MSQIALADQAEISERSAFGEPSNLSMLERASRGVKKARALVAALKLIGDPNKLDQVFEIADEIATPEVMDSILNDIAKTVSGRRAIAARTRVGTMDLKVLGALPEGTLGHAFAQHMLKNKLDPSALPNRPSRDAREFLQAHLYETHDIWHVATGFEADVAGELGLQAFYLAQLPVRLAPALLGGGFFNTMLFAWSDRDRRMQAIVRGWLLGRRAKALFGVDWKTLWATPLEDVRHQLGIDVETVEAVLASFEPATAAA